MSTSIQFRIHSTATQLPLNEWKAIVPSGNLLASKSYLELLEENLAGKMQFFYVLIAQGIETIGAAYFQVVRFRGNQLNEYTKNSSAVAAYFQRTVLGLIDVQLLVGANLFMSGEKGVFWSAGVDEAKQAATYLLLVQRLMAENKNLDGFLMTDVYEKDAALKKVFEAAKIHSIYEEPDMVMKLKKTWMYFDDYLNDLSSKYRVRAKRCLTLSSNVVRSSLSLEEVKLLEPNIFRLYKNTMSRASFSLASLGSGYFSKQKELMPERYRIFGYFLNEELIGFNSLFCMAGRGEVHYIGLDYEVNKTTHLYQRMLYDMVECGIEQRFDELHFGRTATEIKSTIGAQPVHVKGYLMHKNPIINSLLIAPLSKAIKPQEFVFRQPFKS